MLKSMFEQVFGVDLMYEISDSLQKNLFSTTGDYKTAFSMVKTLYDDVVVPVALMLMVIYFLIGLMDKMSSENFTWEQMARQFCMLLASFFLINHGLDILHKLFQIGLIFVGDATTAAEGFLEGLDAGANPDELYESFKNEVKLGDIEIFNNIIRFAYLLLPWALSWILGLCVKIIVYSRVIEIYIRATFAPIALSDFFQNGFQGSGWLSLKNFLAICLQGVFIFGIAALFTALSDVVWRMGGFTDFFASMGVYLALLCSAVMLMFRSLSLAKEFVGGR